MTALTLTPLEVVNVRRERLGLSKKALSEIAGYHARYGQDVLNGKKANPTAIERFERLLDELEAGHCTT